MPLKRRSLQVPYFPWRPNPGCFSYGSQWWVFSTQKITTGSGSDFIPDRNPTNSPPPPIFLGKWLNWRWTGGNDSTTTWGVPKIGLSTNNAPTNYIVVEVIITMLLKSQTTLQSPNHENPENVFDKSIVKSNLRRVFPDHTTAKILKCKNLLDTITV